MEIDYKDLPEYDDFKIEIVRDEYAENPREDFNFATTICMFKKGQHWHSDNIAEQLFFDLEDLREYIEENNCIYLPIYENSDRYDSISVNSSPDPSDWDTGMIGAIFMTPDEVQKAFGKPLEECREEVLATFQSEISTYDAWMSGEVYGYEIKKDDTFLICCSGFYGLDECTADALSIYKAYIGNWETPEKALAFVFADYKNFEILPRSEQTLEMAEFYINSGGNLEYVSEDLQEEVNKTNDSTMQ